MRNGGGVEERRENSSVNSGTHGQGFEFQRHNIATVHHIRCSYLDVQTVSMRNRESFEPKAGER